MSFFVLAEWRLRQAGIGSFVSAEEAEEYRQRMPQPKGWHVLQVDAPKLSVDMLMRRADLAGLYGPGAESSSDH